MLQRGWVTSHLSSSATVVVTLPIAEEECFVANHTATSRRAELVIAERWFSGTEGIARVHFVVPQKLVSRAVELIRS